jgi:hypothetical protein
MTLLKSEIELIWNRLEAFGSVEKIRQVIQMDVNSKDQVLKILAESDPNRLYNLLNGDEFELQVTAWAPEFTYEQYVNEYDVEFSELDKLNWDVEEKSIERATEDGYWLETETCIIDKPNGVELRFEFNLTDGERDVTLATPYNKDDFEMPDCYPFTY